MRGSFYAFLVKSVGGGGGFNELSLQFIILLTHGLSCVFTVMSEINLDKPGFKAKGATTSAPPSSTHLWIILLRLAASVLPVPGG